MRAGQNVVLIAHFVWIIFAVIASILIPSISWKLIALTQPLITLVALILGVVKRNSSYSTDSFVMILIYYLLGCFWMPREYIVRFLQTFPLYAILVGAGYGLARMREHKKIDQQFEV